MTDISSDSLPGSASLAGEAADAWAGCLSQAITCLRQRDFAGARQHLLQGLTVTDSHPMLWVHLAMAERGLARPVAEGAALEGALRADPYCLLALLMRGDWFERQSKRLEAVEAYRAALVVADQEPASQTPDLAFLLKKARDSCQSHDAARSSHIEDCLAQASRHLPASALRRFAHTLDIHLGRRRRFDAQPMGLFFAGLPAVEFFDCRAWPWVPALEAATPDIQAECLAALAYPDETEPYLQYEAHQPLKQWKALNRNPQWSAYHLIKGGERVEPNATRCPRTMAALSHAPQPHQSGRTPVAMFSLLKPQTHIPPHVGISNVRLVAHLPLKIPTDCGLRVGSQEHAWKEGQLCVFDDTIEHEAWNRSDELRAVLIFDVWNPFLTDEERLLVSELARAQDGFAARWGAAAPSNWGG